MVPKDVSFSIAESVLPWTSLSARMDTLTTALHMAFQPSDHITRDTTAQPSQVIGRAHRSVPFVDCTRCKVLKECSFDGDRMPRRRLCQPKSELHRSLLASMKILPIVIAFVLLLTVAVEIAVAAPREPVSNGEYLAHKYLAPSSLRQL